MENTTSSTGMSTVIQQPSSNASIGSTNGSSIHDDDDDDNDVDDDNKDDDDRVDGVNENVYDNDDVYDNTNSIYNNTNDEPFAEGELDMIGNNNHNDDKVQQQPPEPSYTVSDDMASSMKFYTLCVALEAVWKASLGGGGGGSTGTSSGRNVTHSTGKKWSDTQKLWKLLPPKFLQHLQESGSTTTGTTTTTDTNDSHRQQHHHPRTVQSIFPLLRLLLPEKDGSRQFQMAESTIGIMYGTALGLSKQSKKYQMLLYYTDPNYVTTKAAGLGDLSMVVQTVIGSTKLKHVSSTYTIGDINIALDQLASLPALARQLKSNHDWKQQQSTTTITKTPSPSKKKRKNNPALSIKELRSNWLRQLNDGTFRNTLTTNTKNMTNTGLSPLEHKWLVRILLKKMQYGLGWKKLLQWYHPYAAMLWSAHNSLKGICSKICDPEFSKARDAGHLSSTDDSNATNEKTGLASYMIQSLVAPQFGVVFSPMLSERTGFNRLLNDVSSRHRDYLQSSDDKRNKYPKIPTNCLAFVHPAFCVEPKLDGERFLVHVSRDGIVKMHTRKGIWYSELYSPVLGPSIRRAVRKGLDVILDGEVIAWDSVREETVPFGNNRTIAKFRTNWMAKKGLLDERDRGMHDGDNSNKSMNMSNSFIDRSVPEVEMDVGDECWLQYIIFDLIYVDGPEANNLLSQTVSDHIIPRPSAGAIIHLEASERKSVLYKIIDPQPAVVDIVPTWIIRPNGKTDVGEKYFNPLDPTMENGHVARKLDSLSCTLSGLIEDIGSIDAIRRDERSDEQISEARARAIQRIYDATVEEQRLEGLVFKDLSTPYYLGEESKTTRYWHKFKPDYFNGSAASDLDLIVIGAYYATGLRNSGNPSTILCACVDSEDSESFLPVVKVSLGSMDNSQSSEFLTRTGYRRNSNDDDDEDGSKIENMWQKSDWATKYCPEFISHKSFQTNNENNGWRAQKTEYPDMWIHPNDSAVVTLNAGEIVVSDSFSAGITLRFPRITKVRFDADSKDPSNIESEESLREKYWEVQKSRSNTTVESTATTIESLDRSGIGAPCRFLTEKQYHESLRHRKTTSRKTKQQKSVLIPQAEAITKVLNGISFAVLGSTGYSLVEGTIEYDEANEEGWISNAQQFFDDRSVIQFIKKHGGKFKISVDQDCTFVLGGNINDSKVVTYIRAIEHARLQSATFKHKATTKKGQELANIASSEGVIRWTFVVSLVYRWLQAQHTFDESIMTTDPSFVNPSVLDFLVRPKEIPHDDNVMPHFDKRLFETDLSSASKMRRAIELFSKSLYANAGVSMWSKTWQDICMEHLNESDRWIAAGNVQRLWPYNKVTKFCHSPVVVVYPDIFLDGHGCRSEIDVTTENTERRWADSVSTDLETDWIVSSLPLLRVMGGFVTADLHNGVTHVLCDIVNTNDELVFDEKTDVNMFADRQKGMRLLERLHDINADGGKIMFISSNWVRKRKWRRESDEVQTCWPTNRI